MSKFQPGQSGNPAGRPPKRAPRLETPVPLPPNPDASDMNTGIRLLIEDAAAGRRDIAECAAMVSLFRDGIAAEREAEKWDARLKAEFQKQVADAAEALATANLPEETKAQITEFLLHIMQTDFELTLSRISGTPPLSSSPAEKEAP